MDLSVIIVNWNTRDYLNRCLESIRRNSPRHEHEVIVIDNASKDGSASMVCNLFGEVILIENKENAGYAEGNNQGIRAAKGEYILLLNPDTEVTEGAIDSLLNFAREHPDAAAIGCRLIGSDGQVQGSCRSFPYPLAVLFEYIGLSRLFPKSRLFASYRMGYFDYAHEAEVDQPMGSCLLLSRKAVEDVGMFDKAFPIFFNDVDWCYRAKQKGWKVYFTPDVEVIHYGGGSTRQVKRRMIEESHRSLRRFYDKHYRQHIPAPLYWLIELAIVINSFFALRFRNAGE